MYTSSIKYNKRKRNVSTSVDQHSADRVCIHACITFSMKVKLVSLLFCYHYFPFDSGDELPTWYLYPSHRLSPLLLPILHHPVNTHYHHHHHQHVHHHWTWRYLASSPGHRVLLVLYMMPWPNPNHSRSTTIDQASYDLLVVIFSISRIYHIVPTQLSSCPHC